MKMNTSKKKRKCQIKHKMKIKKRIMRSFFQINQNTSKMNIVINDKKGPIEQTRQKHLFIKHPIKMGKNQKSGQKTKMGKKNRKCVIKSTK